MYKKPVRENIVKTTITNNRVDVESKYCNGVYDKPIK